MARPAMIVWSHAHRFFVEGPWQPPATAANGVDVRLLAYVLLSNGKVAVTLITYKPLPRWQAAFMLSVPEMTSGHQLGRNDMRYELDALLGNTQRAGSIIIALCRDRAPLERSHLDDARRARSRSRSPDRRRRSRSPSDHRRRSRSRSPRRYLRSRSPVTRHHSPPIDRTPSACDPREREAALAATPRTPNRSTDEAPVAPLPDAGATVGAVPRTGPDSPAGARDGSTKPRVVVLVGARVNDMLALATAEARALGRPVFTKDMAIEYWHGYAGQPTCIVNGFYGEVHMDMWRLMTLLGPHETRVPMPQAMSVPLCVTTWYIISPSWPQDWYPTAASEWQRELMACIDEVRHV